MACPIKSKPSATSHIFHFHFLQGRGVVLVTSHSHGVGAAFQVVTSQRCCFLPSAGKQRPSLCDKTSLLSSHETLACVREPQEWRQPGESFFMSLTQKLQCVLENTGFPASVKIAPPRTRSSGRQPASEGQSHWQPCTLQGWAKPGGCMICPSASTDDHGRRMQKLDHRHIPHQFSRKVIPQSLLVNTFQGFLTPRVREPFMNLFVCPPVVI